jgi:hypothetical protein
MRARHSLGPFAWAALACGILATGSAIEACSSSSANGSADAAAPAEGGPAADGGDASTPVDATVSDAADGGPGNVSEDATADATDATLDATDAADAGHDGTTAVDSAPPPLDFGLDAATCHLGPRGEPTDLSCTGLYSDWDAKTVAPGLVQYAPGLLLWSDGAAKTRWISLPPGTQIDTSNMDEWTFPVGTKIWKEFRLPIGDGGAETRIETRLLWKLPPDTWYRTTYRWSDDGTSSATELTTGELDAGGTGYEVPNQIRCNECHIGRLDGVLGFEAVSLAAPGATGFTVDKLLDAGLITTAPDASLAIPGDPSAAAALGWLHANCGTACHTGNGLAGATGFYMRLDVATLTSVETTNAYQTGWNVPTVGFFIPDASTTYRLHACDPSTSCVYYRAGHRDGVGGTPAGTQMPPVDSHQVDTVDLASIAAWLDEDCDGGAADAGDAGDGG